MPDGSTCLVCGAGPLCEIHAFGALGRVTSDSRTYPRGGRLAACGGCGGAQKIPDERWIEDCREIYARYDIYHQSGGVEQSVFDPGTGCAERRSVVLARRLAESMSLPEGGQLLDYGCGKGAMLEAFAAVRPGWSLHGLDLDARNLVALRGIPGFARLYTGLDGEGPPALDLVTMSHSLEHLPEPQAALGALRARLAVGGRLFIQVPDATRNPFDLVVADHLCHFSLTTLSRLIGRVGFEIEEVSTEWVHKEISLVGRRSARPPAPSEWRMDPIERAVDRVRWLGTVVDVAGQVARRRPFGLFGSSIGATWLFGCLTEAVDFFVDEDPARVGGEHLGRPIYAPAQVPPGATVFAPLVPAIARSVGARLRGLSFTLEGPPDLPEAAPPR